jgi:microcystin-dependent protein
VADYAVDTTKTSDTSDSIKNSDPIDTSTFCDGSKWIAYKDEKCFKLIIKKWVTYKEAEDICKKERLRTDLYTPRLISIKSATEQEYLTNFVFNTSGVKVNVWIGARRLPENGNEFVWNDGSVIDFDNWVEGSPTKEIGRGCVEMQSRLTRRFSNISDSNLRGINGKWRDVTCESGNYVICQKLQAWSFPKLQQTFLDARKELKDSLENVTKQLDNTKNQLEDTKNQLSDTRNQLDDTRNQLSDIRDKVGASAPAGAIVFFTSNTAPTGWLKANGSEVSRTMYTDLFAAIGTTFGSGDGDKTFNLPDLRGEFIRGWSHGREVDKGRAFGSFQWGSDIPMAGYVGGHTDAAIADAYRDRWVFAGNTFDDGMERNVSPGETRGGTTFPQHKAVFAPATSGLTSITSWNVWKGTRPRNVALLACIKY